MSGLNSALVLVSVLLIITILLQQRSSGLGGAFGGDSSVFTSRRGAEKSLHRLTILLAVILCGLTLWSLWLSRPTPPPTIESNVANVPVEDVAPATNQ